MTIALRGRGTRTRPSLISFPSARMRASQPACSMRHATVSVVARLSGRHSYANTLTIAPSQPLSRDQPQRRSRVSCRSPFAASDSNPSLPDRPVGAHASVAASLYQPVLCGTRPSMSSRASLGGTAMRTLSRSPHLAAGVSTMPALTCAGAWRDCASPSALLSAASCAPPHAHGTQPRRSTCSQCHE